MKNARNIFELIVATFLTAWASWMTVHYIRIDREVSSIKATFGNLPDTRKGDTMLQLKKYAEEKYGKSDLSQYRETEAFIYDSQGRLREKHVKDGNGITRELPKHEGGIRTQEEINAEAFGKSPKAEKKAKAEKAEKKSKKAEAKETASAEAK